MSYLAILNLIMLILSFLGVIGSIINSLWGFAILFMTFAIIFAGCFGATLKKGE